MRCASRPDTPAASAAFGTGAGGKPGNPSIPHVLLRAPLAPARGRGLANSRQGLRVSASSGQNPSNTNLKQTSTLKTDPAIRKD